MTHAKGWGIGAGWAAIVMMVHSPLATTASAADLSPEILWDGGRAEGADACRRAGGRILEMPVAHVRPFRAGSDGSDGAAEGRPQAGRSALCVFGAMAPDTAIVTGSTWRVAAADTASEPPEASLPFGGRCAEECDTSLTLLSDADREALIELPERVRRELGEGEGAGSGAEGGARVARSAAAALANMGSEDEQVVAPLDISSGDVDCTWRRFREGRVVTEPTQRCRIGRDESGAPTLEQVTGEALDLRLEPLTDQTSVYLGRLRSAGEPARGYDRDAVEQAAANRSGLAVEVGNQVHLIGADGGTGFAVLTLSGN
jgi:hypothetical protein